MPRITKQEIEAAIALRPFDPAHAIDAPEAFGNLSEAMQKAVVVSIGRDKAAGLSGNDLRARYGGESKSLGADRDSGLTGPLRRTLLRRYGLDSAATIARSYAEYSDGTPRVGAAHARNYGPRAAERLALQVQEQAAAEEREAKRAAAAAKRAERKAEREAAKAEQSEA